MTAAEAHFFRSQLMNALTIVDQGHIVAKRMKGSWAGAMGQVQFMPSSFLSFAVDFDGDGRKDYGKPGRCIRFGCQLPGQVWMERFADRGRRVELPEGFEAKLINYRKVSKPLAEWQAFGCPSRRGRGSA